MAEPPRLERRLGFFLVLFYGLGTTVGAGIYALPGAIAAEVGYRAPLAFVGAALLAACSAFSFAELSARYPVSAGEARYVREAFGPRFLPLVVGLGVATGGIVSAAALSTAFAGYLRELTGVPAAPLIVALVVALCALAAWGIKQSVLAATAITLLELGGLLLIVVAGADRLWPSCRRAQPPWRRRGSATGPAGWR